MTDQTTQKNEAVPLWRRLPAGVLYLALFAVFSLPILIKGHFPVYINLYDFSMPYVSWKSLQDGLHLHSEFHSPFGWVYHYVYYGLMQLIRGAGGFVEGGALIYLSCMAAAGFALLLLQLFNHHLPQGYKISPWLVSTVLCLCFVVQHIFGMSFTIVTWFGMYNHHMAALIIVQAALWIHWKRLERENPQDLSTHLLVVTSLVQGAVLYITLHYKISAFLAAGGMAALLFVTLSTRRRLLYVAVAGSFFLLSVLATAAAGYNYVAYAQDIAMALAGQKQGLQLKINVSSVQAISLYVVCLVMFFYVWRREKAASRSHPRYFMRMNIAFVSGALVALSCFVLSRGSYYSPYIYPLLVLLFFMLDDKRDAKTHPYAYWGGRIFLFSFQGLCLLAALFVVVLKLSEETTLKPHQMTLSGQVVYLRVPESAYEKVIRDYHIDTFTPEQLIGVSVQHFPLPYAFGEFYASDALAEYEENQRVLSRLGVRPEHKVFAAGFLNLLPAITGTSSPNPSHHWLHMGVSMSVFGLQRAVAETSAASDFVMLRMPGYGHQLFTNCAFYLYNERAGRPFQLVEATPLSIYWARNTVISENKITPLSYKNIVDDHFVEKCDHLLSTKSGVLPWAMAKRSFDIHLSLSYREWAYRSSLRPTAAQTFLELAFSPDFVTPYDVVFDEKDEESFKQGAAKQLEAFSGINQQDIRLMHVMGKDHEAVRQANCAQYEGWRSAGEQFELASVSAYSLVWVRKEVLEANGKKPVALGREVSDEVVSGWCSAKAKLSGRYETF